MILHPHSNRSKRLPDSFGPEGRRLAAHILMKKAVQFFKLAPKEVASSYHLLRLRDPEAGEKKLNHLLKRCKKAQGALQIAALADAKFIPHLRALNIIDGKIQAILRDMKKIAKHPEKSGERFKELQTSFKTLAKAVEESVGLLMK